MSCLLFAVALVAVSRAVGPGLRSRLRELCCSALIGGVGVGAGFTVECAVVSVVVCVIGDCEIFLYGVYNLVLALCRCDVRFYTPLYRCACVCMRVRACV